MTKEEAIEKITEYFDENEEDFNNAIEELDTYNGFLGDGRYYCMDEIDELFSGASPTEILMKAFYGYDADSCDAEGRRGEFNPNSAYFTFSGYGNFVSTNCKDYSDRLDDYFAESYIENAPYLYDVPEEVQEIIDSIEE